MNIINGNEFMSSLNIWVPKKQPPCLIMYAPIKLFKRRLHFWLSNQLPETTLIWSQILPRLKWRNFENTVIMDKCRRRLNSFIGAYMIRHGGCFFGTQILRLLMNSFPVGFGTKSKWFLAIG
jgi:hypothetical protein